MFEQLKYRLAERLKRQPRTWSLAWNTLPRIGCLLPHDKSYYGFRYVTTTSDGLFLDIGANNGITAAGFRRLSSSYRILSIEANRHLEPALLQMKRRIPRFDYLISAVGRQRGTLRLYTPFYRGIAIHSHTASSLDYLRVSLDRDFSAAVVAKIVYDEQTVEVMPIDDLHLSPSIVKIDVEGMDCEVLHGMNQTVSRARPIIMIEFTPGKMIDAAEFLMNRDYRLLVFEHSHNTFRRFDEVQESRQWRESGLQVNLFAIPRESAFLSGVAP